MGGGGDSVIVSSHIVVAALFRYSSDLLGQIAVSFHSYCAALTSVGLINTGFTKFDYMYVWKEEVRGAERVSMREND